MQYDTDDLVKKTLEVIVTEDCVTIEEILLFLPCSRATFYNHQLDKLDSIKEALNFQRTSRKKKQRRNWLLSDNAALQIAEFKLNATEDELERLNTSKVNSNITISKPGIKLVIGAEDTDEDDNG